MSRRIGCPGSLALEERCPNTTSSFAEEGTAAHEVGQWALTEDAPFADIYEGSRTANGWVVDDEMAGYVQVYIDNIRITVKRFEEMGAKVTLLVEQRVDFSSVIGIPNQFGTSDIVMLVEFPDGTTLVSIEDLKYGMGVRVEAQDNDQLRTYALAVVDEYSLAYDIDRVRLVIHQPRLDHISEDELTVAELKEWAGIMIPAARKAVELSDALGETYTVQRLDDEGYLRPSEKNCQFCRAKAHCPALARIAFETVSDDFIDLDAPLEQLKTDLQAGVIKLDEGMLTTKQIARAGFLIDVIEDFCHAVRGRIQAELLSGGTVECEAGGWKLVEGRRGWRYWADKDEAEKLLKAMRLKREEMYDFKLITPAKAEKLLAKENPRRWNKLAKIIDQPNGKPSVAPYTDKRKTYVVPDASADFDNIEEDFSDLA